MGSDFYMWEGGLGWESPEDSKEKNICEREGEKVFQKFLMEKENNDVAVCFSQF